MGIVFPTAYCVPTDGLDTSYAFGHVTVAVELVLAAVELLVDDAALIWNQLEKPLIMGLASSTTFILYHPGPVEGICNSCTD